VVDRDRDHYFASWGGLPPGVAGHVGEAAACRWAVHQDQVGTERAHAGVAGAWEVVVHLAAVEAAPYVGGQAHAKIQTSEA
jgi:hypothetical protein